MGIGSFFLCFGQGNSTFTAEHQPFFIATDPQFQLHLDLRCWMPPCSCEAQPRQVLPNEGRPRSRSRRAVRVGVGWTCEYYISKKRAIAIDRLDVRSVLEPVIAKGVEGRRGNPAINKGIAVHRPAR